MNRSFAQISRTRRTAKPAFLAGVVISMLGSCASMPPPTAELAVAQQAVTRADGADADQYAGEAIAQARSELAQAQVAMAKGREDDARALAMAASADAELAYATSSAAKTRAEYVQLRDEIGELHTRLQLQQDAVQQSPLDIPAADVAAAGAVTTPASRLQALEGDPRLNGFAAYERLRAHQAIDTLAADYSRLGDIATRIADKRVAIAEVAARTEATRREIDRLDRERSELLVEASRREAEQSRQEAERLRMQAQIQAEETQRLRAQADSEAAARQQAEAVIVDVGAAEAAKLKAARDKDAALARKEAELIAAGQATAAKTRGAAPPESRTKNGNKPISGSTKKKKKTIKTKR
jgi:septal ring factor EnvC (AmiA/AmiB activator)